MCAPIGVFMCVCIHVFIISPTFRALTEVDVTLHCMLLNNKLHKNTVFRPLSLSKEIESGETEDASARVSGDNVFVCGAFTPTRKGIWVYGVYGALGHLGTPTRKLVYHGDEHD